MAEKHITETVHDNERGRVAGTMPITDQERQDGVRECYYCAVTLDYMFNTCPICKAEQPRTVEDVEPPF